jgi:hypothetical protein
MESNTTVAQKFFLAISSQGSTPEELDQMTRQLRSELMELEVESVDLVGAKEIPKGAKAGEVLELGTLAVAVLPVFIPKIIEYLQSWSLRAESRKVSVKAQVGDRSIEIEYSPAALSPDGLKNLVETLTGALEGKASAE